MLLSSAFFERNPGLPIVEENINVGFQPEIGSVSTPTYDGLLRFLRLEEAESGFPRRSNSLSQERAWNYHKFLPWTTVLPNNATYDHVYAYFSSDEHVNASEWIVTAQIAAHAQYQNLFAGFISHIFNYTTAVVMWKSQSPWPCLRGFLYDWYLETTGTLRGVRAVLGDSVSVIFDPLLWRLHIINRRVMPLSQSFGASIGARYGWIDLRGTVVSSGELFLLQNDVPAMSSLVLEDRLEWPSTCTDVCFLRLQVVGDTSVEGHVTWHWLTNPAIGDARDFSMLGELRNCQEAKVKLELGECIVAEGAISLDLVVNVLSNSTDILFYPTISLYRVSDDLPLLPIFDSEEANVVILPGTQQKRTVTSPFVFQSGEVVRVVLNSWNAVEICQDLPCFTLDQLKSQVL